ncbi:DUF4132 domain-containing protein [Glycomyces harbinensis]|uniref:DUF4132 domain-containing protein n=1 Tax=Glycomyces harbinensis TaxID=58114 RepID=A0A1G6WK09_9ACTN|nr:DUF4132 domain-containing protein [Glycomyces harbinensis]SDD66168.1 protein of unknown function [Glycomyces harbinensis]
MTEHVVPQEDRFDPPPEWRQLALPRRGDGFRHAYRIGVFEDLATLTERHQDVVDEVLSHELTDPALAERAREHLGGRPDPAGAAVAAIILRGAEHGISDSPAGIGKDRLVLSHAAIRESLDSWVAEHGPAFAVAAAIEDLAATSTTHRQKGHFLRPVVPMYFRNKINVWAPGDGPLAAVRALVAAADDAEHARICARAAEHRDTPLKRLAASLLVPDRADWAAEVLTEGVLPRESTLVERLTWSLVSTPAHLKLIGRKAFEPYYVSREAVAEAIAGLGRAALPVIEKSLQYKLIAGPARGELYNGLAVFPADEAMSLLLDRGAEPRAAAAAAEAASRFPARAARLTAARLPTATPLERARLAALVAASPACLTAPGLTGAERDALAALTADTGLPEAEPERLPAILVSPSWNERRKTKAPGAIEGLTAPDPVIVGRPGEHERALALEPNVIEWDDEFWGDDDHFAGYRDGLNLGDSGLAQLARKGPAIADDVAEAVRRAPWHGRALTPIRSAAAAEIAAHWLVRIKNGRSAALDWFDRHGPHAATLLVPHAFGPKAYQRTTARAGLRLVAWRHGTGAVLRAVEPHGPEAVAAVDAVLDPDLTQPLLSAPNARPWADPDHLPPVLLKDRSAVLGRRAVINLFDVLSQWAPRVPYPGVALAAAGLDRESLARFSLALAEMWISAGTPDGDLWAVEQLALFGGADAARLIEEHAPRWHARHPEWTDIALETLTALPAEDAFDPLHRLSRTAKQPKVREAAARRCAIVAERLGDAPEALADRRAPRLGLDEALTLDFGPRSFRVDVDDRLNLSVTDASGKTRAKPPKPGVRDDPALAAASQARFRGLAKDLAAEITVQSGRLEDAMHTGRVWEPAEFAGLAAHPVIGSLARRLLWLGETDTDPRCFRLAEDGSLADADDKPFELGPDARVRLAHPALLGPDLARWTEVFADYEVLQPFDQLARPAMVLTPEEAESGVLHRFTGRTAVFGAMREVMTWKFLYWGGKQQSVTHRRGTHLFDRELPGGARLMAEIDPSPDLAEPDPQGRHRVLAIWFSTTKNRRSDVPTLRGDAVDPVTVSEILAGLSRATGLLT